MQFYIFRQDQQRNPEIYYLETFVMKQEDAAIIIHAMYAAFNRRAIDEVFTYLHPDVHWPNGWEGGYVDGYDELRDYWTRQWSVLDPEVIPLTVEVLEGNQVSVHVQQTVKDRAGNLVASGNVNHVYTFDGHLIAAMEIGTTS
jgi:nuclear transport factor 2 (NTF2) superfamily protein